MKKYFCALLLFTQLPVYGARYHVRADAPAGGDGLSWENAFRDLQSAIHLATAGRDQIWVAKGTYYPDEGPGQTNNARTSTFRLKSGVKIYGGFSGTGDEMTFSERDLATNVSILSGDIDKNDDTDGRTGNSYHVVNATGADAQVTLDGFTIRAGNADGPSATRNHVGGGLTCDGFGAPVLSNLIIEDNITNLVAAGVYVNAATPVFINVVFRGNFTSTAGSGVTGEGGAIYHNNCSPTYTNCVFSGNRSESSGAAISNHTASPTFTNCTFSGNDSAGQGGAIYNSSDSSVPELINCIVWNNDTAVGEAISRSFNGSRNLIEGAIVDGTKITLNEDPQFVSAIPTAPTVEGDLSLLISSPAIAAGDGFRSGSVNTSGTDAAGNDRFTATIDLGAYEFMGISPFVVTAHEGVGAGTFFEALEKVSHLGKITFDPSLNGETIESINGEFVIDIDVSIDALSLPDGIIFSPGEVSRVMTVTRNAKVFIDNATFTGGRTKDTDLFVNKDGGGIFNSGRLNMLRCRIVGNQTGKGVQDDPGGGSGAGIACAADSILSMTQCEISNNTTGDGFDGTTARPEGGPGGFGAGIFAYTRASVNINRCTIANNRCGNGGRGSQASFGIEETGHPGGRGGGGGGISGFNATFRSWQSTIANNVTGSGGRGGDGNAVAEGEPSDGGPGGDGGNGGAILANGSSVNLDHVTIANNRTGQGGEGGAGGSDLISMGNPGVPGEQGQSGGIEMNTDELTIKNSIIADNEAPKPGQDIRSLAMDAVFINEGCNLLSDAGGLTFSDPEKVVVARSVRLSSLGNYGGRTPSILPLPGSPAIDASLDSLSTRDKRIFSIQGLPDLGSTDYAADRDRDLVLSDLWETDFDGDGTSYGLEYALGSDPEVHDPGNPNLPRINSSNQLVFGINSSASSSTVWIIRRSSDLLDFHEIIYGPTTDRPNGSPFLTIPHDTTDKEFYQVEVIFGD